MPEDLVGLFAALVRLETRLWNEVDARLRAAHDLSLAQLEVLNVVGSAAGCRVLDISRALSITVGGASKVVDRVETSGWCRRSPHPLDGRSNVLGLTRAGQQVLEDANVTFTEVLAHLVGAAASPGELAQLSRTIGQLHEHLDATVEILTGHE